MTYLVIGLIIMAAILLLAAFGNKNSDSTAGSKTPGKSPGGGAGDYEGEGKKEEGKGGGKGGRGVIIDEKLKHPPGGSPPPPKDPPPGSSGEKVETVPIYHFFLPEKGWKCFYCEAVNDSKDDRCQVCGKDRRD